MQETPAAYRIECLEDAVFCAFNRDSFLALCRDLPPFAEGFQRVITAKYLAAQERAIMLANLDARARVHWLLTEKPEWFRRVKDKWLAALLGMSRETFSRLKP
jgi:CRP-like cAMP-binding protein